ncbi:hypothetical protein KAW80_01385 [Candidatus Babeliales bacterium]|nr:hypothetical protein [Candidatus Babeliales bacterium]
MKKQFLLAAFIISLNTLPLTAIDQSIKEVYAKLIGERNPRSEELHSNLQKFVGLVQQKALEIHNKAMTKGKDAFSSHNDLKRLANLFISLLQNQALIVDNVLDKNILKRVVRYRADIVVNKIGKSFIKQAKNNLTKYKKEQSKDLKQKSLNQINYAITWLYPTLKEAHLYGLTNESIKIEHYIKELEGYKNNFKGKLILYPTKS